MATPGLDQWDAHPDGERFLFLVLVPIETDRTLHVVLNWTVLPEEN